MRGVCSSGFANYSVPGSNVMTDTGAKLFNRLNKFV